MIYLYGNRKRRRRHVSDLAGRYDIISEGGKCKIANHPNNPQGQKRKRKKKKSSKTPLKSLGLAHYLQLQQRTMEGITSVLATCSSSSLPNFKTHFSLNTRHRSPPSLFNAQLRPRPLRTCCCSIALEQQPPLDKTSIPQPPIDMMPKIDKSGRFCSPRAARELAL